MKLEILHYVQNDKRGLFVIVKESRFVGTTEESLVCSMRLAAIALINIQIA